ncbi:hypothetical protein DYB32_007382 [Aphanomyces invadans]|uniref:Uncharacterized protein n=1 Tax=Aphanomyces invadans TaxID=157072 RepID=A0A418AP30_9STRA|nr:hypothetical protein DYB32_007382 [Aphanomyces invadans]
MFPSFKSISDRKKNLAQFHDDIATDLLNEELKKQAYQNAIFSNDPLNQSKIKLLTPQTFTMGTQTGTPPLGTASRKDSVSSNTNSSVASEDVGPTPLQRFELMEKTIKQLFMNYPEILLADGNKKYHPIRTDGVPDNDLYFETEKPRTIGRLRRGLTGSGNDVHHCLQKDWLYRPLGDKYVHLKSLANNDLVLKYRSGSSYAKKLPISVDVANMVRSMTLEGKKFDMDQYNQMTNNDQKVNYDLMQVTKAYRMLPKQLSNPYDNDLNIKYQAELDKLVGEIKLGNRNKKNMDELVTLSSYLFKHDGIDFNTYRNYLSLVV